MAPPPTVILDNGAHTMKIGISSFDTLPRLVSNAIIRGKNDKRLYVADEFDDCKDFSSLFYRLPFERGLLVNWDIERTVWDRVFKHVIRLEPKESRLLVTEPCFNLPKIQDNYDQIIFEDYQFQACYRTIAPELCLFNEVGGLFGDKLGSVPDCTLIVDSGYSFTHIIPFYKGQAIAQGIRRLNVGGKLLTNQLKETVSFRAYDMMEETHIINEAKEKCCFVSMDVYKDLEICKKPFRQNSVIQEYVLPDFIHTTAGQIRHPSSNENQRQQSKDQQILMMNNERFMIPEILMRPSDIGIDQAGIPEAIVQSVSATDSSMHGLFYANIILVGGNANFPGYKERIEQDLRQLVPSEYDIRIVVPIDPVTYAWEGGDRFISQSSKSELSRTFVSRKEYLEYGSEICRKKFGSIMI
ncbi:actin-like protein ARP6 [Mycotypha africana]|uniref:actin-like protein ARP6 n=1 Tax=Mycotypha africana TaxID=64632 RepID=UPI0023004C63|nr:actin-like protein ARP6 [Mycotypha africana]KAI8991097.1 actin-like protein ARP6 [Mycotypha africana]